MLEKVLYCDAHFHFSQCLETYAFSENAEITGCSSCHSLEDFDAVPERFVRSFGVHPQNPVKEDLFLLEKLIGEQKIQAVGECGFDYFTEQFRINSPAQKEVFECQLEMALNSRLPLVIHGRKANEVLFRYTNELKNVSGVLFHSFMGSLVEAESFLNKGLNAYFSFGKQVFNNNRKVIDICRNLELSHLLLETDAPYQSLKGEKNTKNTEIIRIYEGVYNLRKENKRENDFAGFARQIMKNFKDFYKV